MMGDASEFDWLNTSVRDREEPTKALYQILREVSRQSGIQFETLLEQAQKSPMSHAEDALRNFRRGRIAKERAMLIHEWLAKEHFDLAQQITPYLFQYRRVSNWETFLTKHTVEGGVTAKPAAEFGLARRDPPADGIPIFRIGQEFLFELQSSAPAYVLAFEGYQNKWHPLPLGQNECDLRVRMPEGVSLLPCDGDGAIIPLAEYDDTGEHRFVFVLCFGPKPLRDQSSLITYAEEHPLTVYQTKTLIIA